jgi:hypothetical protein
MNMNGFDEPALLASRLQFAAGDIGLRDHEVETMIGLPTGSWPMRNSRRMNWHPDCWQEMRVRHLIEVCQRLATLFGPAAADWIRSEHPILRLTPLEFLYSNAAALRAMRDVLRAEEAGF